MVAMPLAPAAPRAHLAHGCLSSLQVGIRPPLTHGQPTEGAWATTAATILPEPFSRGPALPYAPQQATLSTLPEPSTPTSAQPAR